MSVMAWIVRSLLPEGVTEVIEINVLAVAVNPRRDKAEAVELRAGRLVAWRHVRAHGIAVQRHGDSPVAVGGGGIVFERPIMRRAIGVDARRIRAHAAARAAAVISIHGVKMKPFAGRPLDGRAEKILRRGELLRRIHRQAVRGVVEANERRAVTDAPAQADLARSPQWPLQRQGIEPVAVSRQAITVTTITAEEQAAQFTGSLAARVVRGTETEIEARANIAALVGAPVSQSVPLGIAGEILALAMDGHIIQPKGASAVELFHHVEHTEVIELGPLGLVTGAQFARSHVIAQRGLDQPTTAIAVRIVFDRPVIDPPARQFPGVHAVANFVIPPNNPRACPPLLRAVLQMAMEDIAALIDAQSDGVACAPFIESAGIEETDHRVPGAFLDHQRPGGRQDIIKRPCRKYLAVIGRLGCGVHPAADFARSTARMGCVGAPAEVLAN